MKKQKSLGGPLLLGLIALVGSSVARAETPAATGQTEKKASAVKTFKMQDELFGVKPHLGVLMFKGTDDGAVEARGMVGVSLELNLVKAFGEESSAWRNWYIGPSLGAQYSHLGTERADFFGSGDQGGGMNFLLLPVNLKVGYNVNDSFRVSLHGGGNVTYRSVASTLNFGDDAVSSAEKWQMYPNVGADFEFGQNISFMIRPDFTITPGDEVFTGTVGLSIPLG